MRVTLDSNILIYAAHSDDRRHLTAVTLVDRASKADCVQTLQSLGECFRVLTAKRRWRAEDALAALARVRSLFAIVAAVERDLDEAMTAVRDHRLSFWDSMLWATARRAGCRLLLSEDGHDGRNLGGVQFVNPFDPANRKLLDVVFGQEPDP